MAAAQRFSRPIRALRLLSGNQQQRIWRRRSDALAAVVVAFESEDPVAIEQMVEDLRAAEVRRYTATDTPIFLGRRKDLRAVLEDLG